MERQNEELVSLVQNEDDEADDHSFHQVSNSPATMPPAYNDSEPLKIDSESVPADQSTYVPASTVPKYSRSAYSIPAPQNSYNWQGIGSASGMNHVTAAPHIGPDPEAAAQAERNVGNCAVTRCSLVMLLLWAILVFFCCNWIGGLVALYFYREADRAYASGNQSAAKAALRNSIIGMVISTVLSVMLAGGGVVVTLLLNGYL